MIINTIYEMLIFPAPKFNTVTLVKQSNKCVGATLWLEISYRLPENQVSSLSRGQFAKWMEQKYCCVVTANVRSVFPEVFVVRKHAISYFLVLNQRYEELKYPSDLREYYGSIITSFFSIHFPLII